MKMKGEKMSITKIGVTLLIVGLVVGVVAGYGTGFILYQQQISQLESDISTLQSSMTALNSTLQNVQADLSSTQTALSEAQADVTSLQTQLADTQALLAEAQAELIPGRLPILHVEDWWIMEFVSNETTYTMTQNVTGEDPNYYIVYSEYDPPFQGMYNETDWIDKSTIDPVRMQGQGEYTYDNTTIPYTYNITFSYIYQGGVLFPLIVGKELNQTETYTVTSTMIIDGTPYTHEDNYTYTYTLEVEAIENVTVPAGTFTCFKIDMWNATSGDLIYTMWYSDEAKTWVKYIDYTTTPETTYELKDYSV